MKLHSVWAQNFMLIGARRQRVCFDQRGVVLVEGKNGAGKSQIMDAIHWCLYGKLLRDGVILAEDVVHRFTGRDCDVLVEFEDAHGRIWRARRARALKSPKLKALFGDKSSGLTLHRWDDGDEAWIDRTLGTPDQTQVRLERALGLTARAFRAAIVFSQSKALRFLRLADAERKDVVDDILGAPAYRAAQERATAWCARAERDLRDAEVAERETAATLEAALASVRQAAQAADQARARAERAVAARPAAEAAVAAAERAVDACSAEAATLDAAMTDAAAEAEGHADRLGGAKETYRAAQAALELATAGQCPMCGADTHANIKEASARQKAAAEWLERVTAEAAAAVRALQQINQAERACVARTSRAAEQLGVARSELRALDRAAAEAATAAAEVERVERDAQRALDSAKDRVEESQAAQRSAKLQRARAEFWQRGFGPKGIRSLLLDEVLPRLNAAAQRYAGAFGGGVSVVFRATRALAGGGSRDELNCDVSFARGAEKYVTASAGQQARVDLIVGLAIQDVAAGYTSCNVAWYDEVFDGLDADGRERAADMLEARAAGARESVYIVTHNDDLKSRFQGRVLRVEFRDGQTEVSEGSL